MNGNVIGYRIRSRREELGLTQDDLAKEIGLNKSTIQRYESGNISRLKLPVIDAIAQFLHVSPQWIAGKSDTMDEVPRIPANAIPYTPPQYYAPVLGSVRAGVGGLAVQEIIGQEPLDERYANDGEDYFWLKVTGDSMAPRIMEGDLVLIRAQRSVDSGTLAVVTVDGEEGVIKEVYYDDDWIELRSYNPYYPVRRFEGEDVTEICVMGKVMESRRKY